MTIDIIIARGGSKRLPRKNVKPFCGYPLVAWAIMQGRCSHLVDKVYLSTDDDEIEAIGRKYGAEIIRRPDWPDADAASGTRPMGHAVQTLIDKYGAEFDTLITTLPTKPLVRPGDIDSAIKIYRDNGYDSVLYLRPERQVLMFERVTSQKARRIIYNKTYHYLMDGLGFTVTSPGWYMNYFAKAQVEMAGDDTDGTIDKNNANDTIELYYIPSETWQHGDVDTAPEFEFAELLMEHYILKGRGMAVYENYAAQKTKQLAGNWRQQ